MKNIKKIIKNIKDFVSPSPEFVYVANFDRNETLKLLDKHIDGKYKIKIFLSFDNDYGLFQERTKEVMAEFEQVKTLFFIAGFPLQQNNIKYRGTILQSHRLVKPSVILSTRKQWETFLSIKKKHSFGLTGQWKFMERKDTNDCRG